MPRVLVVYYSWTGTTRALAEALARTLRADVGVIADRRPRRGGWGYVRAVADVVLSRTPAIDYTGPDPAAYDVLVVGGPVWASRLAAPVHTFLMTPAARTRPRALFCTSGGPGGADALAREARAWARAPVATLAVTPSDVRSAAGSSRVDAFASAIATASAVVAGVDGRARVSWSQSKT